VAAITSCTNTSNPSVLVAAGLVARKAVERGLTRKPWVKTSLAPGSKVVTGYLRRPASRNISTRSGSTWWVRMHDLHREQRSAAGGRGRQIEARGLIVASVLSGNRNFEGRVQPLVRANYLASPPLVVAYALAGTMNLDLTTEPLEPTRPARPCS